VLCENWSKRAELRAQITRELRPRFTGAPTRRCRINYHY
jgi:hypothetical protein